MHNAFNDKKKIVYSLWLVVKQALLRGPSVVEKRMMKCTEPFWYLILLDIS